MQPARRPVDKSPVPAIGDQDLSPASPAQSSADTNVSSVAQKTFQQIGETIQLLERLQQLSSDAPIINVEKNKETDTEIDQLDDQLSEQEAKVDEAGPGLLGKIKKRRAQAKIKKIRKQIVEAERQHILKKLEHSNADLVKAIHKLDESIAKGEKQTTLWLPFSSTKKHIKEAKASRKKQLETALEEAQKKVKAQKITDSLRSETQKRTSQIEPQALAKCRNKARELVVAQESATHSQDKKKIDSQLAKLETGDPGQLASSLAARRKEAGNKVAFDEALGDFLETLEKSCKKQIVDALVADDQVDLLSLARSCGSRFIRTLGIDGDESRSDSIRVALFSEVFKNSSRLQEIATDIVGGEKNLVAKAMFDAEKLSKEQQERIAKEGILFILRGLRKNLQSNPDLLATAAMLQKETPNSFKNGALSVLFLRWLQPSMSNAIERSLLRSNQEPSAEDKLRSVMLMSRLVQPISTAIAGDSQDLEVNALLDQIRGEIGVAAKFPPLPPPPRPPMKAAPKPPPPPELPPSPRSTTK